MTMIEELIKRLCPDGVEFVELGRVVRILDNLRRPVTRSHRKAGNIPYYGANGIQDYVDDFIFEGTFLLMGEDGSVINKDGSPVLNWATGKIWVNNHAHVMSENSDFAILRFVYFYLQTTNVTSLVRGTPPKLNQQSLRSIPIPIPPLRVQQEIVRTLDLFTDLEAELEAELEARKTQFTFYRDSLLSFEGKNVVWKKLDEIGSFTRGKRFVKTDMLQEGFPCIHYGEMYTHYKISAKEAKSFLAPELASRLRVAKPGDVVIVAAGETIEDIGQGVAWHGTSDVVIHDACFAYAHKMSPNYVAHFLQTDIFHSQIKRHISSGKISSINAAGLGKAMIPVPPIEEQKRIADILDKFHALINDISIGIPAEITARRQQYEYYRNRLLTFKPKQNGAI